jgi:hypothetical protein
MPPDPKLPNLQVAIQATEPVSALADAETAEQLQHISKSHQIEISSKLVALEQQIADLKSFNQDMAQRKDFAFRIFCLTVGWLTTVILVVLANGFGTAGLIPFQLSDPVVLGLIGSTTLNIVGVLVVVVKYLFSRSAES